MKLAVIAADGRSGRAFVKQALSKGHVVRAGIHESHTLPPHPNLTVVGCDATNRVDVQHLIKGQDAVVSFIGHVKGSPDDVQADAMRMVASVMRSQGISRIVSLTGTGVRLPGDKVTFIDRILNTSIRLIDPARIRDGIAHVAALKKSGLDWTVLRVLKLQNIPQSQFVLRSHGPTKSFVSREDVAEAALRVLEQRSFVKEAPILSRP